MLAYCSLQPRVVQQRSLPLLHSNVLAQQSPPHGRARQATHLAAERGEAAQDVLLDAVVVRHNAQRGSAIPVLGCRQGAGGSAVWALQHSKLCAHGTACRTGQRCIAPGTLDAGTSGQAVHRRLALPAHVHSIQWALLVRITTCMCAQRQLAQQGAALGRGVAASSPCSANSHSSPVGSVHSYGSLHVTSLIKSLPTMVQLLVMANRSSSAQADVDAGGWQRLACG